MGQYVITKSNSGFHFNLLAANKEPIGTSEVYTSKAACEKGIESVKNCAPVAAVEDQTAKDYSVEKNPKFEIYNDKAGEFRFRLKAKNGEKILASEGYTAKSSCKNGIDSVINNADSPVEE